MTATHPRPLRRFHTLLAVLLLAGTALPLLRASRASAVVGDKVSIGDLSLNEGNAGQTNFTFTVTLAPGNDTVYGGETVNYETVDGTAVGGDTCAAGVDYISRVSSMNDQDNPPLQFPVSGAKTLPLVIKVCGETQPERPETFSVKLTATNPTLLSDDTGQGTISNEDGTPPAITVTAPSPVAEGNDPNTTTDMVFTVSKTPSTSAGPVSVHYAVVPNTATTPDDYTPPSPASGDLDFTTNATQTITVKVKGDTVDEANETLYLQLSNPVNATTTAVQTAGTISDDDAAPVLSVEPPPATAEDAGNVSFAVNLSAASGQSVTVKYFTSNGSATSGSDFTAANGTLTFAAGQTTKTVQVPLTDDNVYDPNETFSLNLQDPVGATLDPNKTSATATITDDDTAPGLSIADASGAEGTATPGKVHFTVSINPTTARSVTVHYETSDDTAIAGQDYTAAAGNLTIPANASSAGFDVTTTNDALNEANETFKVKLSVPNGAEISDDTAVGTITNDDPAPTYTVSTPAAVAENTTDAKSHFVVTLSAVSGQPAVINYTTGGAGDTATPSSDYAPASSGTLTIPAGQTTGAIDIPVFDDSLDEADAETFTLNLTAGTGTTGSKTATGTITDDDASPTVAIDDLASYEGNSGDTAFTFTVTLSTVSGRDVTVVASTANDTTGAHPASSTGAAGILDYTPQSNVTVTIPAGSTSATFPVVVKGDAAPEFDETFLVNLATPTGATISDTQGIGTILDDDGVVPSITVADASNTEGSGVGFVVSISSPSAQALTVNYTTANGTAVAGTDYTAKSGSVVFAANSTAPQTITVTTTGDILDEDDETLTLTLTGVSPSGFSTIGRSTATGTILDNDGTPSISVSQVASSFAESVGTVTYTLTLSNASGRTVTVNYDTTDGTAKDGSDFTRKTGTATFAPGDTVKTVVVPILDDAIDEPDQTYTFDLLSATNASLSSVAKSVTTTLTDNDAAPVLSIANATATEGDTGTREMTFTVTKTGPTEQTVSAAYATANGTATQPADYTSATGTVTLLASETTKTITVLVAGDDISEQDETLTVTLNAPSAATLGTAVGTGTIIDDDAPAINVDSPAAVNEDAGTVTFTVTLDGPAHQTVTVDYKLTNGSATADDDFTDVTGTLTFAVDEVSKTVVVDITDDDLDEADEDFFLDLSNPQHAPIASGRGRAVILDNDASPTLAIGAPQSVQEPDGANTVTLSYPVTLSAVSGRSTTATYATADGTAKQPGDYVAGTGTVTIPAGDTTGQILVTVKGDSTDEDDETVSVNLTNPSGATLGTASAAGTILDNDLAPSASIKDITVTEPKSSAQTVDAVFTVALSAASAKTVTMAWSTANGTAAQPGDYTASSGTLTIPANGTSGVIKVPVTGDSLSESSETFMVNLASPSNVTLPDTQAVGTIANTSVNGYWIVDLDGVVYNYGDAGNFGDLSDANALNAPIVRIASSPSNQGYWLLGEDGGIFNYGDAGFYDSMGGKPLNAPIVGLAPTKTGKGYWLVASDGGIFAFGDAVFHGSMGGEALNAEIIAMEPTPDGGGYWLLGEDGGIFSFGNAPFHGSTGGQELNAPVLDIEATPTGDGYWLVALDGGVFAFGKAPSKGSMGGKDLNLPVVSMARTASGLGYWLVALDGGIFSFGDAVYQGSLPEDGIDSIVLSMAAMR
jgi:hypothetical protein